MGNLRAIYNNFILHLEYDIEIYRILDKVLCDHEMEKYTCIIVIIPSIKLFLGEGGVAGKKILKN